MTQKHIDIKRQQLLERAREDNDSGGIDVIAADFYFLLSQGAELISANQTTGDGVYVPDGCYLHKCRYNEYVFKAITTSPRDFKSRKRS